MLNGGPRREGFQNMSGDAEKGNELAPLHHSITSSATPSSVPAGR